MTFQDFKAPPRKQQPFANAIECQTRIQTTLKNHFSVDFHFLEDQDTLMSSWCLWPQVNRAYQRCRQGTDIPPPEWAPLFAQFDLSCCLGRNTCSLMSLRMGTSNPGPLLTWAQGQGIAETPCGDKGLGEL